MVSFALLIFAAAFGIKPLGGFFNFVGVGEFSCFIGECAFGACTVCDTVRSIFVFDLAPPLLLLSGVPPLFFF